MAVWEIGLEKALIQAISSETVLVGVLVQLFGKENESKSNNSRFLSLSKSFVTLLYEVLEDCQHTSSTEFGKVTMHTTELCVVLCFKLSLNISFCLTVRPKDSKYYASKKTGISIQ